MADPLRITADWYGESVIVAASGPSLTPEIAQKVRRARWPDMRCRVLAVNDAYRLMPWADALYAADENWWRHQEGAQKFEGMRITSSSSSLEMCDNKSGEFATEFPHVRLVGAMPGKDFSNDNHHIHYGEPPHSGFQAVNLALLLGAKRIVLIGFDYRFIEGRSHFFGDHPTKIRQYGESAYNDFARAFDTAETSVPILNATPASRLKKYRQITLDEFTQAHDSLYRDRAKSPA